MLSAVSGAYCLHRPDDGGSKLLWNDDLYLPEYMAEHPKRQPPSVYILFLVGRETKFRNHIKEQKQL
jgi:hypothetical protein